MLFTTNLRQTLVLSIYNYVVPINHRNQLILVRETSKHSKNSKQQKKHIFNSDFYIKIVYITQKLKISVQGAIQHQFLQEMR